MIKVVVFPYQRRYQGLNDTNKHYEVLCKEKSFLLYQ